MEANLKNLANAIRFLSVDAIEKAKSGHPGMPLGMADIAAVLFTKHIKLDPRNPDWFDRDRFVLSNGHGSMLLYSTLYLLGFNSPTLNDIENFRQLGSKTAGHPEHELLPGVDISTGPLGQGIASAVGMALAERLAAEKFGPSACDHRTYVFCGDGCLMEGISEEAISLAGHWKLGKLTLFWDNNNITIDGTVGQVSSTDQIARFKACQWNTIEIDGHDPDQIDAAIEAAKASDKPTLIACKTTIGFGAPHKQDTSHVHGAPLGAEETAALRQNLGWLCEPFEIPAEILDAWRAAGRRCEAQSDQWHAAQSQNQALKDFIACKLPENWHKELETLKQKTIAEKPAVATRKASQMCLQTLGGENPKIPGLVGGSADLVASNLTAVEGIPQIAYGIREHAMGAIMNGLALHGGFIPYGGTFFVFSDYLRPAMRLAALMGIRAIYVMTHDSIGVGEDGPTHQPVEHLASYRAMPDINVFRPCDVVETAEAWQLAIESERTPSILALSRQNLPLLRTDAKENLTAKGAYIISDTQGGKPRQATILATGSEVSLAVEAQKLLQNEGIETAVVSMPCWELFEKQPGAYRKEILGQAPRVSVEAASLMGWRQYADKAIGLNAFGASGKAEELYKHFGITKEAVVEMVKECLGK